jgi:DNA-binding transcriptional MerR regulator
MAAQAKLLERGERKHLRIGEVSRLTGTKAFVLRYWETEFPTLRPIKTPSGHRLYRRTDIETIFEIKRLLYDEGFTIAGARRYLAEKRDSASPSTPPSLTEDLGGRINRKLLLELRDELRAILSLLKDE